MTHYTADELRLLQAPYRRLFVAAMFVVCLFNFADRAAFAVLAQSIKVDLKITDLELGLLQGLSFAILYALLGIPIGRTAERASRVGIVAAALAIWSAMTVASGVAHNFMQLMLARVGVGIGEAGFGPPMSSLVSDHFPPQRRTSAIALIMLGTPAGIFLGSLTAGWVAAHWQWRAAFWVLGVPGLLAAVLVAKILRDPPRGLADRVPRFTGPPPDFRAFLAKLACGSALRYVLIGGALAGFGMTSISQFLAVFLARVHHLQVRDAGALYGTISGVSLAIGLLAGSYGSQWLTKRDPRWAAWSAALGLGIAPGIYFAALNAAGRVSASALLTLAGSVLLLFYGPTLGLIQNLLEPRMRATGAAVFTTLYTLFGAGLGPTFVGFASDHLALRAFMDGNFQQRCPGGLAAIGGAPALAQACEAAAATGLRQALELAVCVFFLAAAAYLMASRDLRKELHTRPVPAAV